MLDPYSTPMKLARAVGLDGLAWSLRRLHCPVDERALVLEVGSGGNPYPRSNVLLDAYEETRERHWTPLIADRPTVLGFGENLPFRDQAFDFVIASHVLEHSARPEVFLAELQRVARAGYIESPDAFMERINPYRDHRLEVSCEGERLVIFKKSGWKTDPPLVGLYERHAKPWIAGELIPRRPFAFHVRYYWQSGIAFSVLNPEVDATWSPEPVLGTSAGVEPGGAIRRWLTGLLRNTFSQTSRNRTIDLAALLRCPDCGGHAVTQRPQSVDCSDCGASFEVRNGIPLMQGTVSSSRGSRDA